MSANFYDVVVLGTEFGSLLCGALLAKRGFRVLLLGQDALDPTYDIGGRRLPREPFTFHAAHSPIARRVLSELALHQLFRRRATTMDPPLQVAIPDHRFDLPLDGGQLERELAREFPAVMRPIGDFHDWVARSTSELDRLVERDLVWPPETLLERREMARATAHQPFDKNGRASDPLGELPDDHPFRHAVRAPVSFASHLGPEQLCSLAITRLYGSWLRGGATIEGGYPWLRQTLLDRIQTYTGDIRRNERADRIELKRGAVAGVRIAGSGEQVGCSFVVSGSHLSSTMRLLPDRAPFESIFERYGEPQPRYFRYTLNVVVSADAVPVGMGRDVFFLRERKRPPYGENLLHVEAHPPDRRGHRLLCIEALAPRSHIEDDSEHLDSMRERILQSLEELVPFIDRHLVLVDSPHDNREAHEPSGNNILSPREPWHRGPSTMRIVFGYPVRSALGVCALPVRTPIKRLLMCNEQVVPGLGLEGSFLSAWSAARVISKSDRKKEWMRRGLWTKVEV